MHTHIPTGTVTFLFTDIEASSALAQQYPAAMPEILAQHHAILHQAIETHHGHVFQIVGDAFCAAFFTATDALQAALQAQRDLLQAAWNTAPVRVRMGIHTGPAQAGSSQNPAGVYTGYLTLARAERVMSTAYGGQILLSGPTAELVRGELPEGVELLDLGEHRLKGLLNPEHLWQVTAPGLPSEFPALVSLNVIPNNLPVQLNSFIGREYELAQTKELLANTHLLTMIGPGGTGKTRLMLHLAAEVLAEYPDGAWVVELAPLTDPALVLQTVAAALGLREAPGLPLQDWVTQNLCAKRLLLILDNCEHLVETCALLAGHFLRSCPALKMIASSREALGIPGETVYRVPPLTLPDSGSSTVDAVRRSEAVQLFLDRAAAAKPDFTLNEQNASAVAQICRRLDGIPLALELAAARVEMLTPQQIATRLDDRFRLLTGGSRTALPRQQTLRSLIDWSYDLLSGPERLLFARLAVFVDGWSLEAAEAVNPDLDVIELLSQLVRKSLVVAEGREDSAATRFHLLETIHQYARDHLLEMEGAEQVRDRHMAYYRKFAEQADRNMHGPQRLEWVARCELEHENLRAALQWGLESDVDAALWLGGSLAAFWTSRGYIIESRRWLQTALDRAAALPEPGGEAGQQRQAARARALIGTSQMSYGDGNYQTGLEAAQEAERIYRQLGDRDDLGLALCYVGNMAGFLGNIELADRALAEAIQLGKETGNQHILGFAFGVLARYVDLPRGDIDTARLHNDESANIFRKTGLPWAMAHASVAQIHIASALGQWDEARRSAQEALKIFQELRDPLRVSLVYSDLGDVELRAGNLPEAKRYHRQSIEAFQKLGQRASIASELESFAFIAQAHGRPDRAARLLGAAEALGEGTAISSGVKHLEKERAVDWLEAQLDEASFQALWAEGRLMNIDEATAYALEA